MKKHNREKLNRVAHKVNEIIQALECQVGFLDPQLEDANELVEYLGGRKDIPYEDSTAGIYYIMLLHMRWSMRFTMGIENES